MLNAPRLSPSVMLITDHKSNPCVWLKKLSGLRADGLTIEARAGFLGTVGRAGGMYRNERLKTNGLDESYWSLELFPR